MGTPQLRAPGDHPGRGARQDDCGSGHIEVRDSKTRQGYCRSEEVERDCRELARLLIELFLRDRKRRCAENEAGTSASSARHAATGSVTVEASRAVKE